MGCAQLLQIVVGSHVYAYALQNAQPTSAGSSSRSALKRKTQAAETNKPQGTAESYVLASWDRDTHAHA